MTGIGLSRQFQPSRVDAEKVPRVGIRYWHLCETFGSALYQLQLLRLGTRLLLLVQSAVIRLS